MFDGNSAGGRFVSWWVYDVPQGNNFITLPIMKFFAKLRTVLYLLTLLVAVKKINRIKIRCSI